MILHFISFLSKKDVEVYSLNKKIRNISIPATTLSEKFLGSA